MQPEVATEYEYWTRQIEHDPYSGKNRLGIHDVLHAHFLLIDYFHRLGHGFGGAGPRDLGLLHSALGRQTSSYGGISKWSDPYEVCATLIYGLIKNHPFQDANKRTALLSALVLLYRMGRTAVAHRRELEALTVAIARNGLKDEYPSFERFTDDDDGRVKFIGWFLRRNTRPMDKRNYVITFRQLDAALRRHGFWLDSPHDNSIDIMEERTVSRFLGLKKERETARVANIPFPGWNREVTRRVIDEVRQVTRLTIAEGVDSESFFQGLESMDTLIEEYSKPLRRLANK